jgi:hypothetical protein
MQQCRQSLIYGDAPLSALKHILVCKVYYRQINYVKILFFPLKAEYDLSDCKHLVFKKVTYVVFLHNQSCIS